jgi:DNA-binding NtrC family response regulator
LRCATLDAHTAALAGHSPGIQALRRVATALARSDVNLLIHGEPGTGKCAWAEAIGRQGGRGERPFIPLTLTGVAPERAGAALFGSATGAFGSRCRGATIYLEGIEALPFDLQQRLLEALSADEGDAVRIIGGSTCSLSEQVRFGRFSAALYHRLAAVDLTIPPLRDRREDIADIAERSIHDWSARTGAPPPILTDAALTELGAHTWPGNVRELARTIEVACASAPERPLSASSIRAALNGRLRTRTQVAVVPLRQLEADYICAALATCDGNRALTARRLGIGRNTLIRKLKELGLATRETCLDTATPVRESLQCVTG